MFSKERAREEVEKFKIEHLKDIEESIIEDGFLEPSITICTYNKEVDDYGDVIIVIPPALLTVQGKDSFAKVAKEMLKKIASEGYIPLCFSWSSEAWLSKLDLTDKSENAKPEKHEVIMTYFETEDGMSIDCKRIIREGKMVNDSGELVDGIKLVNDYDEVMKNGKAKMSGRFTDIFKSYIEENDV